MPLIGLAASWQERHSCPAKPLFPPSRIGRGWHTWRASLQAAALSRRPATWVQLCTQQVNKDRPHLLGKRAERHLSCFAHSLVGRLVCSCSW